MNENAIILLILFQKNRYILSYTKHFDIHIKLITKNRKHNLCKNDKLSLFSVEVFKNKKAYSKKITST